MTILNGASFTVRRGTITTLIGPNGAGKSTLFKTIFGVLPARGGRVHFDGADITNLPPRALIGRGICYVPHGRNIFPELSVRHNIELGSVAAERGIDVTGRIESALDLFPALRRKSAQQASTLSGGEQKQSGRSEHQPGVVKGEGERRPVDAFQGTDEPRFTAFQNRFRTGQ